MNILSMGSRLENTLQLLNMCKVVLLSARHSIYSECILSLSAVQNPTVWWSVFSTIHTLADDRSWSIWQSCETETFWIKITLANSSLLIQLLLLSQWVSLLGFLINPLTYPQSPVVRIIEVMHWDQSAQLFSLRCNFSLRTLRDLYFWAIIFLMISSFSLSGVFT